MQYTSIYHRIDLAAFAKLWKQLLDASWFSACPSACNNSLHTGPIFMKFNIWIFFEDPSRKFNFHLHLRSITNNLCEHQYKFLIVYRSIILTMRSLSDKTIETPILCSITFLFKSYRLWYTRKVGKYCRVGQATDDNMAHAQCMLGT